jgi:nitrate/nitrite transporter NarK
MGVTPSGTLYFLIPAVYRGLSSREAAALFRHGLDDAMPSLSPPDGSVERPTRIRHVAVAVATLMAVLLYLDRVSLTGYAAEFIRDDLRLTQSQISWLVSAFFWTYGLAQVPSGWLGDRFGPRLMLAVYIVSWSFFTAMTGLSYTFPMLMLMRLGIGLAQAGAYPSCGTLLSEWVPPSSRATASSIVAFGGRVGGAMAPLLTAVMIVWFVPSGTPYEFRPDQIHDGATLSRKLMSAPTEPMTPAAQIRSQLSPEALNRIRGLADRHTAAETEWKSQHSAEGKVPSWPAKTLSTEETAALAGDLNDLLKSPTLYNADAFAKNVSLNGEATNTLHRMEKKETVTDEERGRFNRFLIEGVFSGQVGKLYTHGWRPVIIIYGVAGLFVAAIFWFYFRDTPAQHPSCNASELALIAEGRTPAVTTAKEPFPLRELLTDLSSWCMSLLQFGTNVGWLFIVFLFPRYLSEVHKVPPITVGFLSTVPLTIGMFGLLLGGRLTDLLTARLGVLWGRRLPILVTRFIASSGYGVALLLTLAPADSIYQSPYAYTLAFSLVTLGTDMGIAPTWAFMQDIGGKNVGAVLGWGNMWGNIGAAVAPPLLYNPILGEKPGLAQWSSVFLCCLLAFVLSGIGSLFVNAARPLGQKEPSEAT